MENTQRSDDSQGLGGRLPLLEPDALSGPQRKVYERLNSTIVPWAEGAGFESKTDDGKLIGPFNSFLRSPEIALKLLDLQNAEQKNTSLSARVREVVILAIGSVWRADYELYAHLAVGRKAGLSDEAIRTLVAGGLPDDLSDEEKIAHRYTRQLSETHHVDADLYNAANQAFGPKGLVDIAYLAGIYHTICTLLNGFAVPAPELEDT